MRFLPNENQRGWLAGLLLSVALVLLSAALTERIPEPRFDGREYVHLATNGIFNDDVEAPFVYRVGAWTSAGLTARLLNIPAADAFILLAYLGAVAQLFSVYLLARGLGATLRQALLLVAVVGLSFAHVKFLLFDPYRPDHFAYAFFAFAFLWLMQRRWLPALSAIAAGLLFREFLLVPLALCFGVLLFERGAFTRQTWALCFIGACAALLIGFVLPRLLIPVTATEQIVDPFNDASTLERLVSIPQNWERNRNLLFSIAAYFLPTLLLLSPGRLRVLFAALRTRAHLFLMYAAVMLALMLYGGTDLFRFVTYFFALQVFILLVLLRSGVALWEIALVLVAMLIFNKIGLTIPFGEDLNYYLDFIGAFAYDNRINEVTVRQGEEWIAWLTLAYVLRFVVRINFFATNR